MFEKEAEKWADKLVEKGCVAIAEDRVRQDIQYTFRKSAEFGFNKANEWHYVDKEGLPEDKYKLLVRYVNGDYDIAFNLAGTWRGTSGNELRGAYAWKEIIPPKENKQ